MSDIIPNLENMTDAEKKAALDAIQISIAKSKEVQKKRIGENVGLVIDALKKIESDIRSRFDEVGNAIEQRVATIKDGKDGKDGRDGRNGKDGRDGKQGVQGVKGEDGRDGRDGVDGVDGISVTSARIDFDGSLIIGLSSGVELNVGEVVAPDLAESIKVITNGGGTSQSVLDTLASLQTQINNLIPSQTGNSGKYLTTNGTALSWASVAGGLSYQGTWNASTNTPTLASSTGTNGYYYIVATAGSTNLNGITDWQVGDWLLFNGSVWQKIDQSETLQFVTSTDTSVTVTTTGSTADLAVYSSPRLVSTIRNETGATLTKGTVVYISGASGNKATVSKAIATSDSTSAQTFALVLADISNNNNGTAILAGEISGLDTSAFTNGTQLYLSSTTAGAYTSTKQYAPNHLVYVGVVTRSHVNQGSIEVRIQNGYELDELHDVSAQSPSNGQTLIRNNTTGLWEKANLTAGTAIGVSNGAGSITINNTGVTSAVAGTGISVSGATGAVTISNTGVTSVTGTSPVVSSGGATPAISLASGYGDTQNPYASKTANYFLAAPNGTAGAPTFRAVVAADIPTLNQNTTGTAANITASSNSTLTTLSALSLPGSQVSGNISGNAANVTGTVAVANGGTGLTSTPTNGQIDIGNGTGFTRATLTGTASQVSVTNGAGSITLGLPSTINVNTSGSAASLSATLAIASGGTGQTTANAAFNALAPSQATNSGKYLTTDGTNTSWATVVSGASISNDTTTSTNLYPLFAAATSGVPTTIYTGNTKYLYKPSTGELSAPAPIATNGILLHSTTVATSYTIASGNNGMSVGPVTVASGQAVTISSGQRWLIL